MLSPGTLVAVTLSSSGMTGAPTTSDLAAGVSSELSGLGLTVVSQLINAPGEVNAILTGQWLHYDFTAGLTVRVDNADTFTAASDVAAIVAQTFQDQGATYPSAVQGQITRTVVAPTTGGSWLDSIAAGFSSIGSVGSALQTDAQLLIVGLLLLLGVLIFALAPHSGEIATAFA